MRALLIAFILFLFLLLLLFQFQKTGEFIQTSEDFKPDESRWKVVGRVEIVNGKIISMNMSSD
jgi:Na+-transporting methylmalonyl-CoA/oxaloacetate decarboxylase gamma subunit